MGQEEALQYIVQFAMYTPLNMEKEEGHRKKVEFTQDVLNNQTVSLASQAIIFINQATAKTTYGTCGVKVWLYKGEKISKDDEINNNLKNKNN